ncbi:hypothetical protein [Aggregatibacter actinomycetemcomitans]|uniref:hypothetical protein n=1 Tax=Aggregatibacter actinomycetemcomitans TaxID=714 RepID=UPI00022BFEF9|nr:hypothetical protein [Aggregatibacter actinomycetemcomitans]KOE63173.1 hypothetical protein D17P2_0300635 [Aggregatibacter actinomycetemcomitans serotype c str. D17P-2]
MLTLKKALQTAKELYNILRLQGDYEFLEHLDFDKLNLLYRETAARIDTLNLAEKLQQGDTAHLLNEALEDIYFQFVKTGEAELKLADDLKDIMRKVREGLAGNFDQVDPEFISLREELERIFKKKNLAEVGQDDMKTNIGILETVYAKSKSSTEKTTSCGTNTAATQNTPAPTNACWKIPSSTATNKKSSTRSTASKPTPTKKCWIWRRFWTTRITLKNKCRASS